MKKYQNNWWKVCLVLSTLFLCGLFYTFTKALAAGESDTWVVPLGSENEYQMTVMVTDTEIIQEGRHNAATSGIKYRTTGYYMTLNRYNINGAFTVSNKAFVPVIAKSETVGNQKITTYTIQKRDFINALINLGVTSAMLDNQEGYISVYLHNEFEIYNGTTDIAYKGYTNILGYQEMIQRGKDITGGAGWNNTGDNPTTEILKSYYNYEYKVYPTLFNIEVVAVDEKGNELGVLKSGDKGMFMEKYPRNSSYTAPETYTKNSVVYKAKEEWYCEYTSRTSNAVKKDNKQTGRVISNYPLPDAVKGSKVKLYVVYENKPGIVIHAVDADTGQMIREKIYEGTTDVNVKFKANIDATISKDGIAYKKTVYYSYIYEKSNGGETAVEGVSDTALGPLEFLVPANVKKSSVITVKAYYKKVAGDIPVTVIAVNKSNDTEIKVLAAGSVKGGDTYDYSAPDSITQGSRTYRFTGEWDWRYIPVSTTSPTVKTGSGATVSFIAPAADRVKDRITVKVYYDDKAPTADEIKLRVIMVSGTGALIDEISNETVVRNQAVSKPIQSPRSVNRVSYDYLNRWECDYITSAGSSTIQGSGTKASFGIPAATALGSTVTLKIYYDAAQEVEIPEASAPITLPLDSPAPYGVINGDKYSSSYFTSELGIPTTESQYVYVKTKDYLLGYTLANRTGKITFTVPVTMNYTLEYMSATPESAGGPKPVTDIVTDIQLIRVEKAYSYWEIVSLEFYPVNSANVYNYSLPGGGVTLSANGTYLDIPGLTTRHSSDLREHVLPPSQVTAGIVLHAAEPVTSDTSDRPAVEFEDLTSYAIRMTEEARVKNDLLIFDGSVVLSDTPSAKITSSPNISSLRQSNTIIPDKALYTEGQIVDALKVNGAYSSTGNVSYRLHPASVNASYSSRLFNVSVNDIIIHTPVICVPVINSDNTKWSQVITPVTDAVQLVLDPDTALNDFSVMISNTLEHSSRPGYRTRDFSRSMIDPAYISYIARQEGIIRNEMKLPFDVYLDTAADNNNDNDKYIKAGTWIVLGRETYRFYVPMWVQEGIYTAEFRTVAVNGADKLNRTETTRNSSRNSYVAVSTKQFQISGRIYGLTLYDISDYPKWENVFRKKNTMLFKYFEGSADGTKRTGYNDSYAYYYTVGTRDQYGSETGRNSKYTTPLVNGSHPKYSNLGVLKTGYAVRFLLDTTGEMYSNACQVKITPIFYYVDGEGKNRRQVDLYYDEEINGKYNRLVKVGEGIDLVNIQSGTTGNVYNRIPEAEIANTAAVMNTTYAKIANQRSTMYSYSQIRILNSFRTFIGKEYASSIARLNSFIDVQSITGQTELNLSKYMQRWYGTYKIPVNVHAVPTGYDVRDCLRSHGIDYREEFWLTGGYIIVNFNIVTIDKNGKENLSYINGNNYLNNGNCSMWVTEGAPVEKKDNKGNVFHLKAGDFIIYYTDLKYSDDYEGDLY